ncbi:NAD(P)H-binding protein [Leifsonia kafniensis]|uniref:NAD(P)H-binding protein n=1 Tax=Leifsonia kafniensis TaxID=475957 RepID=A0ABP7K4X6_9MICO
MTSPILVTGGSGTLGRQVVTLLRGTGREVRVLSRHPQSPVDGVDFVTGDLSTGEGITGAVQGTEIIVHCAGGSSGDDLKARTLVRAAARSGRPHLVFISVVGAGSIPMRSKADRTMFGYFGSKLAAERVVSGSGLPFTTLRATQFYDLVLLVAEQLVKLPVIPAPSGFRFQPVDSTEVAARLTELALGEPAGRVADFGGPRTYTLADLVYSYLEAVHRHKLLLPLYLPGQAARAIRAGAALAPAQAVGRRTWEEFLAEHLGRTA